MIFRTVFFNSLDFNNPKVLDYRDDGQALPNGSVVAGTFLLTDDNDVVASIVRDDIWAADPDQIRATAQ